MTSFLSDWTKPEQYPDPNEADLQQWAWEFLRRNKDYQELWEESLTRYGVVDPSSNHLFQEKFFIKIPMNPKSGNASPHFLTDQIKLYSYNFPYDKRSKPTLPEEIEKTEVLVRFDLSLPLKKQCQRASDRLLGLQRLLEREDKVAVKKHRNSLSYYPKYLRILDAREAGAKFKTIAAIIFPDVENIYPEYKAERKVKDYFHSAKLLRDRDYKLIVTTADDKN